MPFELLEAAGHAHTARDIQRSRPQYLGVDRRSRLMVAAGRSQRGAQQTHLEVLRVLARETVDRCCRSFKLPRSLQHRDLLDEQICCDGCRPFGQQSERFAMSVELLQAARQPEAACAIQRPGAQRFGVDLGRCRMVAARRRHLALQPAHLWVIRVLSRKRADCCHGGVEFPGPPQHCDLLDQQCSGAGHQRQALREDCERVPMAADLLQGAHQLDAISHVQRLQAQHLGVDF